MKNVCASDRRFYKSSCRVLFHSSSFGFRLSGARVLASLNKAAQSFVGDIEVAMFAQNLLFPPVTAALPPPTQNVDAEGFELGARLGGRQVLQVFQQFFARPLVCQRFIPPVGIVSFGTLPHYQAQPFGIHSF
jgi:hypothetical protein